MSLIWHDATKAKRLARSQPLRWREVDWLAVVCVCSAVLLTLAWLRCIWLAVRWLLHSELGG